jgi:5-methylcytosine-specific restriction endonuclease McrA
MKEKRVSERILKIPALVLIKDNSDLQTSEIIETLNSLLEPVGQDSRLATNRNDTYFDQKVRNLKSHNSLTEYTNYSKDDGWNISSDGKIFLLDNEELINSIMTVLYDTTFTYDQKIDFIDEAIVDLFPRRKSAKKKKSTIKKKKSKKIYYYDENERIKGEGKTVIRKVKVKERSSKLRKAAIEHYSVGGKITCNICGFDFSHTYDGLGQGYIEMHHKKPIFQYEYEDEDIVIKEAIKNLVPVCANCHRMLHKNKTVVYDDVVGIYIEQKKKNSK